MIKEKETFFLPSKNGKDKMNLTINFNSEEGVKNGEAIKINWGEKEIVISTGDLFLIMLSIVKDEQANKLVRPFARKLSKKYERRLVSFKSTKDIKKGDEVSCVINVPVEVIDYTGKIADDKIITI